MPVPSSMSESRNVRDYKGKRTANEVSGSSKDGRKTLRKAAFNMATRRVHHKGMYYTLWYEKCGATYAVNEAVLEGLISSLCNTCDDLPYSPTIASKYRAPNVCSEDKGCKIKSFKHPGLRPIILVLIKYKQNFIWAITKQGPSQVCRDLCTQTARSITVDANKMRRAGRPISNGTAHKFWVNHEWYHNGRPLSTVQVAKTKHCWALHWCPEMKGSNSLADFDIDTC